MALSKIRRTREVTKSPGGKHIEISKYNPMTGKGTFKEKDIEYKAKGSPRVKYVEKQVVKRDNDLNWKSSKESRKLVVGGKKMKAESNFTTYKMGGMTTLKKSPKVSVTAGGEKHVVYKKTTKRGEGKVGNIMVNHPTKDKGEWDTIDLTAKGRAKTVKQGIADTKRWHRENPYPKMAHGGAQQAAIAIAMKKAGKKPKSLPKAKLGGGKNCWPGYAKKGSKMLNGKVVNNCVKRM
jgi:hypothetical protein